MSSRARPARGYNELRAAEREAVKQRTAIIMPIAKAVIAMADTGEAAQ
jgi:hypothetical protein